VASHDQTWDTVLILAISFFGVTFCGGICQDSEAKSMMMQVHPRFDADRFFSKSQG